MRKRTDTEVSIKDSVDLGAKMWVAFDSVRNNHESMDHEFRQLMNRHRYAKGWDVVLERIGWALFPVMYHMTEPIQKQHIAELLDFISTWGEHPKRTKAVVLPFKSPTRKPLRKTK